MSNHRGNAVEGDAARIEDLLVHWEIARQQGHVLTAEQLCGDEPHLAQALTEQIRILNRTSWMLNDPAGSTFEHTMLDPMSSAAAVGDTTGQDSSLTAQHTLENRIPRAFDSIDAARDDSTPGSASAELVTNIPGFRLISELGRGGFGIVFQAVDEQLQRSVAIKMPLLRSTRAREEYLREARHAAGLDIVGIVPVYQVGITDTDLPFVVQKYIEGRTLADILKSGGRLSAAQTIEVLVAICQAVGLAHAQGLVHRDLKPANIIIDAEGKPWVTDFGLAITEEEQSARRGEVAGTPSYMAPEQLKGRVDWIDGRTDLWAIGVIMYECLTGKLPFQAPDLSSLCEQILSREPRPICQRAPHLQRQWDEIFQKCCAKSIKERYASAYDVARDLLQLHQSLTHSSLQPPNPVLASREQLHRDSPLAVSVQATANSLTQKPRKRPRIVILSGVGGLVIMAGLLVGGAPWIKNPRGDRQESQDGQDRQALDTAGLAAAQPLPATAEVVQVTANDELGYLQDVIDAARDGQTLMLEPGEYRGSLVIRKSLQLAAADPRAAMGTKLVGIGGGCVTMLAPVALELRDLILFTELEPNQSANTIDVELGRLTVVNCEIASDTYDCVRLGKDTSLAAEDCDLQSTRHPAIYAKQPRLLDVRNCRFQLPSIDDQDNGSLVGIQVQQGGGLVSECTFEGPRATAIEWRDATAPVTVRDCQFEHLDRGLAIFGCRDVAIIGRLRPSGFSNCGTAIEIQSCTGRLQNIDIDAQSRPNSLGVKLGGRLHDSEAFVIERCEMKNLEAGMIASQALVRATQLTLLDATKHGIVLINHSHLDLIGSQILRCGNIGLLLESSTAQLDRCHTADHPGAGIVVDGPQDALRASGSMVTGNAVGVLLMSGGIELDGGEMLQNGTGILVARKHLLYHQRTSDAPLHVTAQRISLLDNERALEFWSSGSFELKACQYSDPRDAEPFLAEGLSLSIEDGRTYVHASTATAP